MARKKKLSLEQEFAKRVKAHKTFIIMDAIISTGEKIIKNTSKKIIVSSANLSRKEKKVIVFINISPV